MTRTVLLIEDSKDDILFMRRAFAKSGVPHSLQVAEDGAAALAYLSGADEYADRGRFPLPCLVLLDLKMPTVPGFAVLSWVRSQPGFSSMPLVVLTSSDHPSDIAQAYALGANSFLSKPGSSEELNALVQSLADYWLTKNVASSSLTLRQSASEAREDLVQSVPR